MKRILIILTALCLSVAAQNKKVLDIIEQSNSDNEQTSFAKTTIYSSRQISNEQISATLIEGGYYTLGTVSGLDASKLDDNCPLSYGHPYAMTSYPLFSIDSTWYTMDAFFPGPGQRIMHSSEDSLSLTYTVENLFSIYFSISIEGDNYELNLQSANLDTVPHHIGLGFVYDPTLAAGGDGALFIADQHISAETTFKTALSSFTVRERSESAQGLGIECQFEDSAHVIAANWLQIYETNDPVIVNPSNLPLYDLAIKMFWPETLLEPSGKHGTSMQMKLLQPDFSSAVFTRWDLPHFLSLEDNIMFPREFSTCMEVFSANNESYDNCQIKLEFPTTLSSEIDNYDLSISAGTPFYQKINMQSSLSDEDKVVGIAVSVIQDDKVLDRFDRFVYVPETPITYSGLQIVNDTLSVERFPQTEIIFALEKQASGQRILDLFSENVFLRENDQKISDFTFEKYTGGGSNLADVVFVLDISGSMGNEINAVRENIGEFADSLLAKGFDYQIGVITFSTTVDNIWDLTDDIEQIKHNLSGINLWGGTEDSPSALWEATQLSFRSGSRRTIIWITDEPYPEHNYTKEQVVNRMLDMGIVVHGVGLVSLQTDWFNPIVIPTGGNFYDINGNFKDILLDVSNIGGQSRYILSYHSQQDLESLEIELEIHYAGLGVIKKYTVDTSQSVSGSFAKLACYPNPFNPTVTFSISPAEYEQGKLTIFNVLGQAVKTFSLHNGISTITWRADNDIQSRVSSGFYYVALQLVDHSGKIHQEKAKILYLK